jgi:hypothetical protein
VIAKLAPIAASGSRAESVACPLRGAIAWQHPDRDTSGLLPPT